MGANLSSDNNILTQNDPYKFNYHQILLPASLITVGALALRNYGHFHESEIHLAHVMNPE
ncbi:MAG: hypothetical protein SNH01_09295 [Rikenellaceae bacterium]